MDVNERFWSKVEKSDGCWMWTGGCMKAGYGIFSTDWRKSNVLAHRYSYQQAIGEIPAGMVLDHTCHNNSECAGGTECPHRKCVNPAHLKPKTVAENVAASHLAGTNKTHCRNGHEFTPENTNIRKNGWRNCLTCKRTSNRESARRKAEVPTPKKGKK